MVDYKIAAATTESRVRVIVKIIYGRITVRISGGRLFGGGAEYRTIFSAFRPRLLCKLDVRD